MMLSREKNMKLPRNFILKDFKWSMTREAWTRNHSGQTEWFVKTNWGNTKMLWKTVSTHCGSIQNVLRQAFKVNFNTADHGTFMQSIRRRVKHHFESILKLTTQKGNAHLGLGQFDEAKECYESLRPLGENLVADQYLKKLHEAQERYRNSF